MATRKKRSSPYWVFGLIAAIVVVAVTIVLHREGFSGWGSYLLAINAAVLLFYAYDKAVAGRKMLRVPELVLHGMALVGGSPTALLAQKLLHHKTVKGRFQYAFWGIVIVQVAALGFWLWNRRA